MRLEHEFTVPVPVDVAWPVLLDPERIAPCMPGATLKSAEGEEFSGSVKVKLGPVSLMYKGNGSFTEVDHEARRAVVEASGKDSRGNGTASAAVTARLSSEGSGTRVHVETELKVTGKPAQLGRGLISDVAQKLIDQFSECLASRLAGGESETATEPERRERRSEEQGGTAATAGSAGNGSGPVASDDGHGAAPRSEAVSGSSAEGVSGAAGATSRTEPGWKVTGAESGASRSRSTAELSAVRSGERPSAAGNDAVDLLDTAGVPVLKRLVPVVAGLAVLTVVLVVLRRRRHRLR
ncbi:carbon monoxide dehydrogenase [Actinopolyspora erythraea]|uniref:Carbon monoxide dehydrogenase n=1 Tax=Actinopolyspora erythraea TaxID=414996 RepID=A0A099D1S6_9ACTN|nr:SRPBCC family protein [Actinopolyspora erythraea]ASU77364.1 carbon monoxide dehydrogenase [Actinopolyspora erythraea]KGI80138.1 carbon monoxide dehydrogenase [Actinopolyspora erythraea]